VRRPERRGEVVVEEEEEPDAARTMHATHLGDRVERRRARADTEGRREAQTALRRGEDAGARC
jgi:hypothetical protein